MSTSESTYEVRPEASIIHSQVGRPGFELESVNPAGASIALPHDKESIPETQPAPANITGEPYDIANILSPVLIPGSREQSHRKVVLKDIFLECSSPDYFSDELTLVAVCGGSFDPLPLPKIYPTKWKAIGNIEFSKDGGDEAFLTLSADEIYAMGCAEEDTQVEHFLESVKENNDIGVKMTSTVVSSLAPFRSRALNLAMIEASQAWLNAQESQRRFEGTSKIDDISRAISYCERAIYCLPPGVDINPHMSNFLGNIYSERFERTEDLRDINCAIFHHQKAVGSTPSTHADFPGWLNNLGNSYLLRFKHTGDLRISIMQYLITRPRLYLLLLTIPTFPVG